jgi:hypothetical protein
MKTNMLAEKLPSVIILMYAAFLSSDVMTDWRYSPFDSGGHTAFAIWFSLWLVLAKTDVKPSNFLSFAAGLCLILGLMMDLNVLFHLALLIAALQFLPREACSYAHLISGFLWLPAFGYAMAMVGIEESSAATVRISLALLMTIVVVIIATTRKLELRYEPH